MFAPVLLSRNVCGSSAVSNFGFGIISPKVVREVEKEGMRVQKTKLFP